jgi:hypothetical protein
MNGGETKKLLATIIINYHLQEEGFTAVSSSL